MAELEALALREVTFVEPFVKVEQTFRVVALAELLELAGIMPREMVDTIALNDYRYRDTVRALLEAEALLAVERDGARSRWTPEVRSGWSSTRPAATTASSTPGTGACGASIRRGRRMADPMRSAASIRSGQRSGR
jgi:hypothetical protein